MVHVTVIISFNRTQKISCDGQLSAQCIRSSDSCIIDLYAIVQRLIFWLLFYQEKSDRDVALIGSRKFDKKS